MFQASKQNSLSCRNTSDELQESKKFSKIIHFLFQTMSPISGVPRGGLGVFKLSPLNSKDATKNRAKLTRLWKLLKKIAEFRMPTHQKKLLNLGCQHTKMFGKEAVKF